MKVDGKIWLDGGDVTRAIDAYLVAHGIYVTGPRTIKVGGKLLDDEKAAVVILDPSAHHSYPMRAPE